MKKRTFKKESIFYILFFIIISILSIYFLVDTEPSSNTNWLLISILSVAALECLYWSNFFKATMDNCKTVIGATVLGKFLSAFVTTTITCITTLIFGILYGLYTIIKEHYAFLFRWAIIFIGVSVFISLYIWLNSFRIDKNAIKENKTKKKSLNMTAEEYKNSLTLWEKIMQKLILEKIPDLYQCDCSEDSEYVFYGIKKGDEIYECNLCNEKRNIKQIKKLAEEIEEKEDKVRNKVRTKKLAEQQQEKVKLEAKKDERSRIAKAELELLEEIDKLVEQNKKQKKDKSY